MNKKIDLYCFTHAGGAATFFNVLDKHLVENIELQKLEYSGHGLRRKEPFYQNFTELANDMFEMICNRENRERPYALMGYSMGCISLVETLKLICQKQLLLPSHVFLAAHEPKTKLELLNYSEDEKDEIIRHRTLAFGGIPGQIQNNDIFWRMYMPIYRADYKLISEYDFEDMGCYRNIPTTIFYSEEDTPLKNMLDWQSVFPDKNEFLRYTGSHFFIQQYYKEIATVVNERLGL